MARYFNLTGPGIAGGKDTHELIAPGEANDISSITITPAGSDPVIFKLFIEDDPISGTSRRISMLNNISVPYGSGLILNETSMFSFGEEFGLYIKISSTDSIDLIIN
mgnify:CR=1 FL=1|tara:strand:- start:596 stop:916 length:321 start_codon:yes stop_codon:yes gene_type:complete